MIQTAALPRRALLITAILLLAEFLIVGLTFKHGIDFYCRDDWPILACGGSSKSLAAIYCVIAALTLLAMLRPAMFRDLLTEAGRDWRWLALNVAGLLIAMIPVLFLRRGSGTTTLLPAMACWVPGMAMMLWGAMAFLAPRWRWRVFAQAAGGALPVTVAAGAVTPLLAVMLQPIWQLDRIADMTFQAVVWLIDLLGYRTWANAEAKMIGSGDFAISVAPACSGIEGIALVTLFVTLYLWLFRQELRFPRALILYPLGIAASVVLNIVRIAILLIIGLKGNPELAVGGFHSHAGWMMFTLVALGIIALARGIPALNRPQGAVDTLPLSPLRADPVAAQILPFAIFMLTAVVAPAISQAPAMFYPIRVIILAAAVVLFWRIWRGYDWRVSPVALAVGALIGIGWVLIPVPAAEGPPPYGSLTGGGVVLWFLFRGIGTVLLVPLVEEIFFRGYLESRIRGSAPEAPAPRFRVILAALVTSALFAALHDRWAEAFVAGLALSWMARRRGRITDAIAAHAVANLLVFAVAVALGRMEII